MKSITYLALITLLILGVACEKEFSANDIVETPNFVAAVESEAATDGVGSKDCLSFVYPLTMIMPDGSSVTANDENEAGQAKKAWYTANPNDKGDIELQFPVQVSIQGTTKSMNDEKQLAEAFAYCKGEKELCYQFNFPLTLLMPDQSNSVVNDEVEFDQAVKNWYTANPNSKEKIELQFPIQITIKGATKTIASAKVLKKLDAACYGKDKKNEKSGK